MTDLNAHIEQLQDYYEVDEVIDAGEGEERELKIIRALLPYNNPDWTGTDVLHSVIRILKDMSVLIEIVSAPEYLTNASATTYTCPCKLSTTVNLLHCIESLYLHLYDNHLESCQTTHFSVRDFCYPPYDLRHFGRYPPLHSDSVWTEHTVLQPYQGQEIKLQVGERVLVRRPDIIIQDGMLVCRRAEDHLPNNIYSLPNWILKAAE